MNYITPEGFEALNKELEDLWKERGRVVDAVSEAAAMGDRSENAEYIYGKKRLRELDSKIRFISKRINTVKIADNIVKDKDEILFGAVVTFKDKATNHQLTFHLVGSDEADIKNGKLSIDSPIGSALVNLKKGDETDVMTPGGKKTYVIVDFHY